MKVISYINNIPMENCTEEEVQKFFLQVLPKSMKVIGWELTEKCPTKNIGKYQVSDVQGA